MIFRLRSATQYVPGVLLLATAVSPLAAQRPVPAQRGGTPRSDTPQLVVSVLASSDPALGLAASDAIRRRIQDQHHATELYVVPDPTVKKTLLDAGFNPDSTLGTSDLLALAKQVRGDYALAGTVERTTSGVRTSIRLLAEKAKQLVAEPLATIVGPDFGDVAKQVDRAVSEALRALAFHRDCMNALASGDYPRAMAAAQQGLRIRPTSAALNQCVLSTLRATNARPDSIIAVASQITAADSGSVIAWAMLDEAYGQTGDTTRAVGAARMLHRLDEANAGFTSRFVDRLVASGQLEPALAVLDTALRSSPAASGLLRQRWLLHLRLSRYADAIASGAAFVAADTAAATVDYFERQLIAARTTRDSASTRRIALDAAARFPKNVSFLMILARDAIEQNTPGEALTLVERVFAIEPANLAAWQIAIAAHARANGTDSAVAASRRALAAGIAKEPVGASLVTVVSPTFAAAQASSKREDWEAVLRTAQAVDTVAPSPRSAFYLGIAAFQIASDEYQPLVDYPNRRTPTRAEREKACGSATRFEDFARTVSIALPRGGSVEPTVASRILAALPEMSTFVTSVKQASCRARPDE